MTDAIVVFGTNDQELYAGTQLLKLGYAPLVFVTSDKPKTAFFNFFKTYNLAPEQFIFDRELAVNTSNYSTDTAEFLRKYRLQSMRLVVGSIELGSLNILLNYAANLRSTLLWYFVHSSE